MKEFINFWLKQLHSKEPCSMCRGTKQLVREDSLFYTMVIPCDHCNQTGVASVEATRNLQDAGVEIAQYARELEEKLSNCHICGDV